MTTWEQLETQRSRMEDMQSITPMWECAIWLDLMLTQQREILDELRALRQEREAAKK